ncbi:Transcription factor/transcription regulator [Rhynchospora pubera]|uniref:Transcription factor/transcription regulator n=1 Tax=Rhynchospora pubera TaxID=906938 RepID=A0AAV8D0B6_9POAL|nr:Transcription factor/transcription regulator [Rhynchospora pubera]
MKETMPMIKRRRVCSVEINSTTTFNIFCVKYLAYLLQALMCSNTSIKLLTDKNGEQKLDIKQRVRFQLDMAMVVSVGTHFKWTRTLKQKLGCSCHWEPITSSVAKMSDEQCKCCNVPRFVNCISVQIRREGNEMETGERDEVRQCIDVLREMVPTGDEDCSINELIEEVVSYVTCLQFQVGVLRSLLSNS